MNKIILSVLSGAVAISTSLGAFGQEAKAPGQIVAEMQARQMIEAGKELTKLAALGIQQAGYTKAIASAKRTQGGFKILEVNSAKVSSLTFTIGSATLTADILALIASKTQLAAKVGTLPQTLLKSTLWLTGAYILATGAEVYGNSQVTISEGEMEAAQKSLTALDGVIQAQKDYIVRISQKIGASYDPTHQILDFRGIPNPPAGLQNIIGGTGGMVSLMDLNKLVTAKVAQQMGQ